MSFLPNKAQSSVAFTLVSIVQTLVRTVFYPVLKKVVDKKPTFRHFYKAPRVWKPRCRKYTFTSCSTICRIKETNICVINTIEQTVLAKLNGNTDLKKKSNYSDIPTFSNFPSKLISTPKLSSKPNVTFEKLVHLFFPQ